MRRIVAGVLALGLFGGGLVLLESTLVDAEPAGPAAEVIEAVRPAGPDQGHEVDHGCKFPWDGKKPPPPWLVGKWVDESPSRCIPVPDCGAFWHYFHKMNEIGPAINRVQAEFPRFPCPPPCNNEDFAEDFPALCCKRVIILREVSDEPRDGRDINPCLPPPCLPTRETQINLLDPKLCCAREAIVDAVLLPPCGGPDA
ncbi:MAG: hypothetical protein GY929_16010 [Actinomycetia bacterium]|nr:hypothetical protein [Actinomycetes bacterium]